MQLGSPFDALHHALSAAVMKDLPDITYQTRDWVAWRKLTQDQQNSALLTNSYPVILSTRRPQIDEVEIVMFPQTWGSTSLGYGGIGGAAMTPAYTVIVTHHNHACVYFGCNKLAYALAFDQMSAAGLENFQQDMAAHAMVAVDKMSKYA